MLRELHISNLAVISDVRIELSAGLNCFTGATGAGKSLVIGALEVLLGLRSSAEMLRPGVNEGRVSGMFEIANSDLLQRIRGVTDVDVAADGGELLLTRRLYASGRSSVSLNGNPITLAMVKQVSENLVDVHGQHDHQYLLRPANQVDVIDQFGGLVALRQAYHQTYQKLVAARQRLADLSANRALREQQLELYRFQAEEIDAAGLDPAEFEQLSARVSVLQNLEKLKTDAGSAHAALYDADDSILDRLKTISGVLADLAGLDANLKPTADGMRDAAIQIEEIAFDLARYLDKLDLDPGELTQASDRLNTIYRTLNKYAGLARGQYGAGTAAGSTEPASDIDAALLYRQRIGQNIVELERATDDFAGLQKQLQPLLAELQHQGHELTARRTAVARKLAPLIERQLADLGMEKAKFTVAMSPATGTITGEALPATPSGFDTVEFVVQTNPGQLAQPLRKTASGGELSRIMLALKGILASSDRISVLVFDEIDANVGGRLGSIIGSKLRALAAHHQVLCITHLPQIACYADRHLTVRKEIVAGETETKVRVMDGAERLGELAEMIGGQRVTDVTRAQAQELLDTARAEAGTGELRPDKSNKARPAGQGKGRNGRSVRNAK